MEVLKKRGEGQKLPVIKKQVVSCPLMAAFDTIVDINFCSTSCQFFSRVVESSDGKSLGDVECNYPRRIKIYPVAE